MRYRKTVEEWKDIENDLYASGSPNDDLENEIYKGFWRWASSLKAPIEAIIRFPWDYIFASGNQTTFRL
jgi:hypothetical protein